MDEQQRMRELQPLADALALMVRGATDAKVEQTGGHVYCATASTVGAWTVYGDEAGWSLSDANGESIAYGGWYEDGRFLTVDEDTGTLDADECEAAAVAFAGALQALLSSTR